MCKLVSGNLDADQGEHRQLDELPTWHWLRAQVGTWQHPFLATWRRFARCGAESLEKARRWLVSDLLKKSLVSCSQRAPLKSVLQSFGASKMCGILTNISTVQSGVLELSERVLLTTN